MSLIFEVSRELSTSWIKHRNSSMAAAIAYRSIFSLAPILALVAMTYTLLQQNYLVNHLLNNYAPQTEVTSRVDDVVDQISQTVIANNFTSFNPTNLITIFLIMIIGASSVFRELSIALNNIWEVTEKSSITYLVYQRLLGAFVIFGLIILLIISSLANLLISQLHQILGEIVPMLASISSLLTFGIMPLLIFTILILVYIGMPKIKIEFKDVWPSAALTTILILIGTSIMRLAIGYMDYATYWGAAGSLIVFLIGVYYLSMAVLFGAELARLFSRRWGSRSQ